MVIGITGGIGCGKTTAAKLFEGRGFRRLDCDAIAHDLLSRDAETLAEIQAAFGESVLKPEGGVDRERLGAIVFENPERLRSLEGILHPRIRRVWEDRIASGSEEDWVVEVPLLFEKNLQNRVDFTVCVFSDLSTQVERLGRKGMSRSQALARVDRQMPLAEKAEQADCVLLNEGSLEFLKDQVDQLFTRL